MSEEWWPWIDLLKKSVIYSPDTGRFVWLSKPDTSRENRRWNTRYSGTPAIESLTRRGYLCGRFMGKSILAHRLVWAFEVGNLPEFGIDHVNGCKTDNRFDNLRDVNQLMNNKNTSVRRDNTSGCSGVVRSGIGWAARIDVDGNRHHLGSFDDIESAIEVRRKIQREYGFSERHGI